MDRAGRKASQLSIDEMTIVFDLVARGGSREEARGLLCSRGRDRSTAYRLFNVVRELEVRDLDVLDTPTAQGIGEAARYSTTASYVQDVYLRWRAWQGRANQCDELTHQEFLRHRLTALILEVRPLAKSIPGVFRLSYRPEDAANRLKWIEADGVSKMEWELGVEEQPGWPLVEQHLTSGTPEVAQALATVKQSYAGYCERLLTLEEAYWERAKGHQHQTTVGPVFNNSHFYRAILAEVDQAAENNEGCEYQYSQGPGNFLVAFAGVELITRAGDLTTAQQLVDLHRRWRREMRSEHLTQLLKLRHDIQENAGMVVAGIERLEQGGLIPGRCDHPL